MNRYKLTRKLFIVVSMIVCLCFSGCSMFPSVSLTEEQNELVAEYAAGVLMKYDANHKMGLMPVSEIAEDDIEEEPSEIVVEPVQEEVEEQNVTVIESAEPDVDLSGESVVVESTKSISDVFGTTGFDILYNKMDVTKIYPEEESEDLVFSMQASPGNMLMVLHFNVTNLNDSVSMFQPGNSGVKSRVVVNAGDRVPAQFTILLNDLLSYSGEFAPYGMEDMVMVYEIPEDVAASISTLKLVLVGSDGDNIYNII